MKMQSLWPPAAAAALVMLLTSPARPQAVPSFELGSWVAPAGCPSKEQVRAEVLRLVGPDHDARKRLVAGATIEHDEGVFRLVLTTDFDGSLGERRLSAGSCRALTDAAVLVLALILNPEARLEPRDARRAPAAASRRREPEEPRELRALVAGYVGVSSGTANSPAPEIGAGAGFRIERASLRASVSYGPSHDVRLSGDSGPGASLWFFSGSALGCWDFAGDFVVSPCAGAEFTWLAGSGIDVSSPESADVHWVSIKAGLLGGLPIGGFVTLQLAGYVLVPMHRPVLYFDDLGRLQQPPAVGGELRVGAELALP